MKPALLLMLLAVMPMNSHAKVFSQGIYGDDHRREPYELEDQSMNVFSQSSVALIPEENLLLDGQVYRLSGQTYGKEYQLCPSERFFEQQTPAFCSGTLVAEDIVLTAGHCFESPEDCKKTKFVFGYSLPEPGKLPREIAANDVFSCGEILAREEQNDLNPEYGVDYALVRLDRPAKNRRLVPLEPTGGPKTGDGLFTFGYPAGLPLKFVINGKVRNPGKNLFQTNLDTYGGNSGSAVMNLATKKLEGILIRGDYDFEYGEQNCYVSKHCEDEGCQGEWVMKIDEILARIQKAKNKL
jgi:V8-like Glu-specific endopeptidase